MLRYISILGSTGSIGTQAVEVIRNLKDIRIAALTTNRNIELLEKQIREFSPLIAVVMDEERAAKLKERLNGCGTKILSGMEGLVAAATMKEISVVLVSVVGNIGIRPTYEAILAGKDIALATKEVLVSGGRLIIDEAEKNHVSIYPVDSEHSAIFQSLQGNAMNPIEKILLTASGGPFRGKTYEELKNVTPKQALKHPNWSMGAKITIDSATLMNKGLEVIEAKWLFNVDVDKIEVLVHPQSILHSAVEYEDGAVIGQMGTPDMKLPISYALTYPKRVKNDFPRLSLSQIGSLTFDKPDMDTFKCLKLTYRAIKTGGTMPAVLNAANEIAVARFLEGEIGFLDIAKIIESTMDAYNVKYDYTIDDLLDADSWGRAFASGVTV